MSNTWETPVAEELKMDAEIGSYQDDSDPVNDPVFVQTASTEELAAMRATVLGSAAGGGVPQWNCGCPICIEARRPGGRVAPRTQDSVVIHGRAPVLLNASPDVLRQLEQTPALHPKAPRHAPVSAIVLTNGDLDHVLGLFSLRESSPLVVYATARVQAGLEENAFLRTLRRFPEQLSFRELVLDREEELRDAAGAPLDVRVTAFAVPGKLPVHLGALRPSPEDNVGLALSSAGRTLGYVTTAGAPGAYLDRLDALDLLLFDGTFFTDDELPRQGLGKARARDMAHWAIDGDDGSLAAFAARPARRRVFTHINNSNPILVEGSPERERVLAAGFAIAHDGMELEA